MERQSESDTQSGTIAQAGDAAGVQAATLDELVQRMYAAWDGYSAVLAEAVRARVDRAPRDVQHDSWCIQEQAFDRVHNAERAVIDHLYAARPR